MTLFASITVLVIAGLTGWILVKIAIKFFLFPSTNSQVISTHRQTGLSKKQQALPIEIGRLLNEEFNLFEKLEKQVAHPGNLQKLRPEIEQHIDHFLRSRLKEVFPMASMMGEKTIVQLKAAFLLEVEELFPVVMSSYMEKLQQDPGIGNMLAEKLAGLTSQQIKKIVKPFISKQIHYAEIFGLVLGISIGLISLVVLFFLT